MDCKNISKENFFFFFQQQSYFFRNLIQTEKITWIYRWHRWIWRKNEKLNGMAPSEL